MTMIRGWALALAVLAACGQANAQEVTLKPLIDARLRYEQVDQDGIADTADAVTLRIRSGIQASTGPWSALVESEATLAIDGHYNDGLNGRALPTVADPQNIELNRALVRYTAHGIDATVGRQALDLVDGRFVGSAPWRQNQQTFDAARLRWNGRQAGLPGLEIDIVQAWSFRTIYGIDGRGARPQAVPGRNWFGVASYATPAGTLSGFAYLVDQDDAALQGFRLSSQSYGARLAGGRPIGGGWKVAYALSAARQSDYRRNPDRYAASYYLAEAVVTGRMLSLTGGYEILGASHGGALTSFQTPYGSLFKFQGWAGKFTTTPPDGVRDLYGTAGASFKAKGLVSSYGLGATFHRFDSDRLQRHYGDEIDVIAQARVRRTTVSARLARYTADRFATDTTKLFLTAEWVLP